MSWCELLTKPVQCGAVAQTCINATVVVCPVEGIKACFPNFFEHFDFAWHELSKLASRISRNNAHRFALAANTYWQCFDTANTLDGIREFANKAEDKYRAACMDQSFKLLISQPPIENFKSLGLKSKNQVPAKTNVQP